MKYEAPSTFLPKGELDGICIKNLPMWFEFYPNIGVVVFPQFQKEYHFTNRARHMTRDLRMLARRTCGENCTGGCFLQLVQTAKNRRNNRR